MMTEHSFAPIAALDLDPIKVKLMHKESGEGWSREYADAIEFEYRRFLYLVKKFPNEQTAPLFDVDIFWHYHILDTMKYAADCEAVFGYFLHHFPYVGLRGEEDLEAHHRVGERMRELYEQTYGEAYLRAQQHRGGSPGQVAFSSPATATTFADGTADVAFSSPATKEALAVAFSSPATMNASSIGPDKVAFSSPATRVAFSSPATSVAFSSPATGVAFSSPTAPASSAGIASETDQPGSSQRQGSATFYSTRPTLSGAA